MHNLLLSFPVALFRFQQLNSKNTISFSLANTSFTKQRIILFCTKRNTCKPVFLTLLQRPENVPPLHTTFMKPYRRSSTTKHFQLCFSSIGRELGSGNRNYKNVTVTLKVNGPKRTRGYTDSFMLYFQTASSKVLSNFLFYFPALQPFRIQPVPSDKKILLKSHLTLRFSM